MNQQQVTDEMNKMVAFIKQEALEKAREIKIKADEEFQIEKGNLVRTETTNIEQFFSKKTKQALINRKIQQSMSRNKLRLTVLEKHTEFLNELFQPVVLKSMTDAQYADLLPRLILESFYQLMEPSVVVACRQADIALVEQAIKVATKDYAAELGPISVVIDPKPLPDSSFGGVVVSCFDGRIKSTNTMDARLSLLADSMMPKVKTMLFGPSKTRKFFN